MAEVVVTFQDAVRGSDGHAYLAQVCARPGDTGNWEGWLEFTPVSGGPVRRSPRETSQPNYPDLQYWAGGLSVTYLEGALERALDAGGR
jgi:hypothetical protein